MNFIQGLWEDKEGKWDVQGLLGLQKEIKANINNLVRTYLKSNA